MIDYEKWEREIQEWDEKHRIPLQAEIKKKLIDKHKKYIIDCYDEWVGIDGYDAGIADAYLEISNLFNKRVGGIDWNYLAGYLSALSRASKLAVNSKYFAET